MLHRVDLSKRFCIAVFLRSPSPAEIWVSIQAMWTLMYVGPPEKLSWNRGSSDMSTEMCSNHTCERVKLLRVRVEIGRKIGVVERYHDPPRSDIHQDSFRPGAKGHQRCMPTNGRMRSQCNRWTTASMPHLSCFRFAQGCLTPLNTAIFGCKLLAGFRIEVGSGVVLTFQGGGVTRETLSSTCTITIPYTSFRFRFTKLHWYVVLRAVLRLLV